MIETPRYVIDIDRFQKNCLDISDAFGEKWGTNILFGYSVKTNRDAVLIRNAVDDLGWKAEIVSSDEYKYCKSLGIEDACIILNGPYKGELIGSKQVNAKIINLDNNDEVKKFSNEFKNYEGFVGLRVNFDLESKCPGETTAGSEVSRFGIDADSTEFYECIDTLINNGICNIGLHLHTSTKTRSLNVFRELAKEAVELKRKTNFNFTFLDIGGGLFGGQIVEGKPSMKEYANEICNVLFEEFDPQATMLVLEPGASVLATCVTYDTKIVNKRIIRNTTILTVDGSLLHINPFLNKRIQPFTVVSNQNLGRSIVHKQIIAGATCMEDDRFAVLENEEELQEGDILSFKYAGAYTMAFNSHFILDPPRVDYYENGFLRREKDV